MASSNPTMNPDVYNRALDEVAHQPTHSVMTMPSTVAKTAFLTAILLVSGGLTWYTTQQSGNTAQLQGMMVLGALGGFVMAMITSFFPKASPFTSPIYAALEGVFLAGISMILEARFPGVVVQAIGLTIAVMTMMLFLYGTRIVQATEKFKLGVIAATGAVCLVYLASIILSFFGMTVPYIHQSGAIGIGFSAVVVVIASLNLILDFDFIEQGVRARAPKYMEWYAGFSLLVTLVWMYIEILRLLSKLRGSND